MPRTRYDDFKFSLLRGGSKSARSRRAAGVFPATDSTTIGFARPSNDQVRRGGTEPPFQDQMPGDIPP